MLECLISVGLTCSDGQKIINNIQLNKALSNSLKFELVKEIKTIFPKCSFKYK